MAKPLLDSIPNVDSAKLLKLRQGSKIKAKKLVKKFRNITLTISITTSLFLLLIVFQRRETYRNNPSSKIRTSGSLSKDVETPSLWNEGQWPHIPVANKAATKTCISEVGPFFKNFSSMQQDRGLVTLHYRVFLNTSTGLGNYLFMYASLQGLSHRCGLLPVLGINEPQFPLIDVFDLNAKHVSLGRFKWEMVRGNLCCCCFDRKIFGDIENSFELQKNEPVNVVLYGYFQSWKYFEPIREKLRKELLFKPHILEAANDILQQIRKEHCSYLRDSKEDCLIVGAHVRRRDMLHPVRIRHGYVAASEVYFRKAIEVLKQKHSTAGKLVVVFLGDDFAWNSKTFGNGSSNGYSISVPKPSHPAVDLCFLTLCDHLIISTGTFGWWGAYLLQKPQGATVVYFKDHVKEGTKMWKGTNNEDYFRLEWVGLSSEH